MPLTAPNSSTLSFNNQTGTAYTLSAIDAGNAVTMSNAAANTVTVPPASATPLPIGAPIVIQQIGAGQTTVVAGSGVVIDTASTLKARTQFSVLTLVQESANVWTLTGDFA